MVVLTKELESMDETILSLYYQPFSWLPHCTIGKQLSKEEMQKALIELSVYFVPIDGYVTRIGVAKTNPHRDIKIWNLKAGMVCSGASESAMAQWASAFTESAIGVSKMVGDLAGPCLFALFMGISRVLYGKFSEKLDLTGVMLLCGIAGDLGAMVSPAMVGSISEMAGGNLKTGLLIAAVFPLALVLGLLILKKKVSFKSR